MVEARSGHVGRVDPGGIDQHRVLERPALGRTDLPKGTGPTTITEVKAGALIPIKSIGLALATPTGLLHAHAVSHSPLGNVVHASAGYHSKVTATKGTKRLIVSFDVDVPMSLSFAATAAGAAAAETSVQLRVIEHGDAGDKEVCAANTRISSSVVALIGLAPHLRPGTKASVDCKVLRTTPDKQQEYTLVIQGSAAAAVKAVGGAHAVLDAKVKAPTVFLER